MPAMRTYNPLTPQNPAESLRTNTCRYARYAETHPVQPLKGLREPRTVSVSYRALPPYGATLPFRISAIHPVVPQFILNSEFLILNWTYTFSAKEKDSETGLSYFGSRYYSSDLSIWLSVDPMASKYPSLSPYVYCANNPVKLVDPNGEEIVNVYKDAYEYVSKQYSEAKKNWEAFKGDRKAEGYKEARQKYKDAKRSYDDISYKYHIVDNAISNVKQYNPELYEKMDNMKDADGNSVDIRIVIDYSKNKEGWGTIPSNSNCPSALSISLNPNANFENVSTDMGMVLSNELGHLSYIIPNWNTYQDFLNNKVNRMSHDGHSNNDESGKEANTQTLIYRKNKFGY